MQRGSILYDDNLDASTSSEGDSCPTSELDLLNLRVPKSGGRSRKRQPELPDEEPDLPNLLDLPRSLNLRPFASPGLAITKLPHKHSSPFNITSIQRTSSLQCISARTHQNRYEHQVTFAEAKYSSGEGPSGKSDSKLWKGKGTPRIIKAIRQHSRRFNRQDRSESPPRPQEDNSKSSVVVLYHGKPPAPSPPPPSSKLLIHPSQSEHTLVRIPCPPLPPPPENPLPSRSQLTEPPSADAFSPKIPLRRKKTNLRKYRQASRKRDPLNVNIYHESCAIQDSPPRVHENSWIAQVKSSRIQKNFWKIQEDQLSKNPFKSEDTPIKARGKAPKDKGYLSNIREIDPKIEGQLRTSKKIIRPSRSSRERCRSSDSLACTSLQMAHRPNQRREGSQDHQSFLNGGHNLGFLMQHMQNHPKETGDNRSLKSDETKRVFPFQATPSGNLKIIPNQVVFESKKVSVLVADPRHTKVNVKAELSRPGIDINRTGIDLPPGVTPSTINQLQAQQNLPHTESEYRPRTQPYRSNHHHSVMEQQQAAQAATLRYTPANEVPLSSLGFNGEQPIDWDNISLPEKTDLYQELARRITNYKNADCIIRLGHDEFHCHLLVLQSYSAFFDEKNYKEVDLTGSSVTSKAFSIIYDWMISPTRESCHLLRRDNILEIFTAAQHLGIKELEEQCWGFIDNDELFCEDTAFLLYLEARKISNTAVMELMIPRIMKFFLMLVSTKDFLELAVEELCLLLKSNYICVNSEMEVLMSAVRWLMHDWEGRRQYLLEVLKCVRFGLIAPWQLVDVKRNPENPEFMELMSYPEVQKMVDDGLAFVIIKYWYGNQTEDYYHWIDLLGLTEPTNRNWAGEDKNYVTYREFLLYLDEYQTTKMPELKSRKSRAKPIPPNSPPKECPSPPPARSRSNYVQNHAPMEGGSSGQGGVPLNVIRPPKYPPPGQQPKMPVPAYLPPGTPASMMVPPEVLSDYLSNLDRNLKGGKKMLEESEKIGKFPNYGNRLSAGGEVMNRMCDMGKYDGIHPEEGCTERKTLDFQDRHERNVQQTYYCQQWEPNLIFPKKKQTWGEKSHQERHESEESIKSEEDAATTIQAVYRGYKARRQFRNIRKSSSEEKQNARRVAELLAVPIGKNLHKPLEPIKVTPSSASQGKNEKDHKQLPSPRRNRRDSPVVKNGDLKDNEETSNSKKDLEGLRFDVLTPQPTPRSVKKSQPKDLSAINSSANHLNLTKPIQTIKFPSFFHNYNERLNSVSPSENTDTDDPFSPRIEERSMIDLQTRVILHHNSTLNSNLLHSVASEHQPRPKARDLQGQKASNFKRPLPQRLSMSMLGTDMDNYYMDNSLFFPEREAVLVFGGVDPHVEYGCTGNTGKDMYRFKPADNVWEFGGEIPEPRYHHSAVYLKGRIYLVGGADPRDDDPQRKSMVVGTVWSYDPTTRIWFREPELLTPRKNFGLVVSHGKMFAIGGQDKNGIALRSVESFNPTDCMWREMQPMYIARVGPASAKYQDLIWVAGGMTKSRKEPLSREVECYDPNNNLWLKAEPLRSPRCFASMFVVSDCLYIIGGARKTLNAESTESIDSIDTWDPMNCVWRQQAEMSIARHGHSTGCIGDQLMIIGGLTTTSMRTLKSVECLCCQRGKWIKGVSALPYALSGHSTVSLPPANLLTVS